jgi:hypothetical protein
VRVPRVPRLASFARIAPVRYGLACRPWLYIMPCMPRYRPLSGEQLRAIYETNPTPAVKRLLWEIHRLRAVVLRADDFVRTLARYKGDSRLDPGSGLALANLREALHEEPVVKEDEARRLQT